MMTVTVPPRLPLGRLYGNDSDEDPYIGSLLYVHDLRLLISPERATGHMYWCAVLADLAQPGEVPATHRNFADDALAVALAGVDPASADMYFLTWLARAAVKLWPAADWHTVREMARLGRVPATATISMYHNVTERVCAATHAWPETLIQVIRKLIELRLLEETDEGPKTRHSLGTYKTVADDLPGWPWPAVTPPMAALDTFENGGHLNGVGTEPPTWRPFARSDES